jgi:2-phosphosulfolactate phosphatase
VVFSAHAETLLASSFVCAAATAQYLRWLNPRRVTFVISGADSQQQIDGRPIGEGDEDAACADYLEALLHGLSPDPAPFIRRVRESPDGQVHADPTQPFYVATDLDDCTQIDRFDFAMQIRRQDGLLVMHKVTELYIG